MSLRNATPLVWQPRGVSDTMDASSAFAGAMASLQNLIPDPTTKDLWQCRPAVEALVDFAGNSFSSGFSSGFGVLFDPPVTQITGLTVVGRYAYGMLSSGRNPGKDEPFAYDLVARGVITIAGVTNDNSPNSPPTSGEWTPPHLEVVGAKVIVSHPGFTGAANVMFGVLDISDPAAPVWSGANTAPNMLLSPPVWVSQFGQRAYYFCNPPNLQPNATFSDVLVPTTVTNANQILTFDDNVPLTCGGGLPLNNQLGGIIQSLIVFKGVANMYQITGDYALNTLTRNTLNVATGTLAPNSVCPTTKGLAFMSPDGLRVVDFTAQVSDPIGAAGDGVSVPFIYAATPSRMAAAFGSGMYRVNVTNGFIVANPRQDWWFDFVRGVWSGPHTCRVDLVAPYNKTFICAVGTMLCQSDIRQRTASVFTEFGAQLTFNFLTSLLPDTQTMDMVCVVETTVHAQFGGVAPFSAYMQDQNGAVLDVVTLTPPGQPTLWGQFTWGHALWGGLFTALAPRRLPWRQPLVFTRAQLGVSGQSSVDVRLGQVHLRYQRLGYLQATS